MIILEPSHQLPPPTAGHPKGHLGAPWPSAISTAFRLRDNALSKTPFEPTAGRWAAYLDSSNRGPFRWGDPFNLRLDPVTISYPRHEPSRGIGGEPKRSVDGQPRSPSNNRGQTVGRQATQRVNLPSGGSFSNITEDVRQYAAEQALSEEEGLQKDMAEKSKEFIEAGAEVYAKA